MNQQHIILERSKTRNRKIMIIEKIKQETGIDVTLKSRKA
jgi:hypothetical protein